MTSPLTYPKDLQTDHVDYITFTHHEYRTNRNIAGSGVNGTGASNAAAPAGGPAIVLYMPTSTPAMNAANDWGAKNFDGNLGAMVGNLAAGASETVMGITDVSYDGMKKTGKKLVGDIQKQFEAGGKLAGGAAKQVGVNFIAGVANMNPNQLLAMSRGEIFNPNVELLYSGPKVRGFSMNFTFVPKSADEAVVVNNIIKEFKKWSAPADIGNGMYKVPDVWQVTYMHNGDVNKNMNAFKKAALTNVGVQSNPGLDMHMTFPNGMPVLTTLSLNFTEVDVIIREDHDQAPTNVGY